MNTEHNRRVPLWMTILIILVALPVFSFPAILSAASPLQGLAKTLIWIYPFYVPIAAYLAWISYGQRTDITWILLILILLTHPAVWFLVSYSA